jgi:hypothetical protein
MYFFIGSEFSDRVLQNVKLPQPRMAIFREWWKFTTINSPQTGESPAPLPEMDFIGAHDETLPAAVRIGNPDCSPFAIHG